MPAATSATPRAADFIADCLKQGMGYAELLVKDIPGAQFAHMPHPNMNHPAFCVGHLSIYPNRVLTLMGMADLVAERSGYANLFKAGVACVEQDGRYPAKDEIVEYYLERHRAVAAVLPGISDGVFQRENPAEGRFKAMFPTVGGAVNFLLNSHHMVHLGQVSAWRRAMGMSSAM